MQTRKISTINKGEGLAYDIRFTILMFNNELFLVVTLKEISKYIKGDSGYLIMSDGSSVDISRSKKEMLLQKIQNGK